MSTFFPFKMCRMLMGVLFDYLNDLYLWENTSSSFISSQVYLDMVSSHESLTLVRNTVVNFTADLGHSIALHIVNELENALDTMLLISYSSYSLKFNDLCQLVDIGVVYNFKLSSFILDALNESFDGNNRFVCFLLLLTCSLI